MELKSTVTSKSGEVLNVVYNDMESELDLGDRKIKAVRAYCFYKDKFVIVYADNKDYWTPPSGSVEEGEDIQSAIIREVKEETNMKVTKQKFIGCQDVFEPEGRVLYTRSVCIVEPYGDFINDPDGDITEIKLIDPKDYKQYFDLGEIGDYIMNRALEIKKEME